MKKILYVSSVFPKIEDNSTIYSDLIEELIKHGDQVFVLCYDDSITPFSLNYTKERGAEVFRVGCFPIYNVNKIRKVFGILMLPFFMKKGLKKIEINKFDLLLYESPPVTWNSLVKYIKKKSTIKTFLMLKDIFPQNAVDMKFIKKSGIVYNFFRKKEKALYNLSDYIGCMSKKNMEYLEVHNPYISKEKIVYFPNTKKNKFSNIIFENKKEKLLFMYGGNIGIPQGVIKIAEAIKNFQNYENVEFLFIGRGTEWNKVKFYFKDQKNVKVIKNLPRDEYEKILMDCDVCFVFLDPMFTIPNFPSRILSYMEQGKAIIAATDENTDIKDYIVNNEIGLWSNSNDYKSLERNIKILLNNPTLLEKYKINSRKAFLRDFQVEKSVELLHKYID